VVEPTSRNASNDKKTNLTNCNFKIIEILTKLTGMDNTKG
jgi:hypothetical protein